MAPCSNNTMHANAFRRKKDDKLRIDKLNLSAVGWDGGAEFALLICVADENAREKWQGGEQEKRESRDARLWRKEGRASSRESGYVPSTLALPTW